MGDRIGGNDHNTAVPALPDGYVDRPVFIDTLDTAVGTGLALVTGGIGWGKTTAVSAWAARRGAGWLTLDRRDCSVRRLTDRLLAAARRRLPDLPPELAAAGRARDRPARRRAKVAVNALVGLLAGDSGEDVVIVLDGLHELPPNGPAMDLVTGVCRRRPPGLRLVLVTRRTPVEWSAPACALMPYQIGPELLAFTEDETAIFLKATLGRADPAAVSDVSSLTSGWPAAACLAAEALRAAGGHCLPHAGVRALDALATRILQPQPEATRRLLVTAALLGTIDVPLGEALGHPDAPTIVPVLAQQGLLLPDGPRTSSWSVLAPVRNLLIRGENTGRTPRGGSTGRTPARELHARAAAYRLGQAQHGQARHGQAHYGQALRHLTAAGDRSAVERLLIDQGDKLLGEGEAAAVVSAADALDLRCADPRLLTVLGRARQVQGDWLAALACLRAAAGDAAPEPAVALRLGQLHYLSGRTDLALETLKRARHGEADDADEVRLLCEGAVWLRAAGEDDQARSAATRAAEAAESCGDPATLAQSHRVLALLAGHDGDRSANDLHHQRALRLAAELRDDQLRLGLLINRASYLVEEGSPAEALDTADAALRLGIDSGLVGYEPFCFSIRARARARLGRFDEALTDVDTAQRRWRDIGPSLDIAFGLLVRGDVHRRRGEPSQARAATEEALRSTTDTAGMRPLRALILSTLARARAADDLPAARALAEQAVALATGTGRVPALLARGWVALLRGDRAAAGADAAQARAVAGARRDHGGLAEALELTVLSAGKPANVAAGLLDEAAGLWHDLGDPIGAARVRLVAAQLAGPIGQPAAETATAQLRAYGVRLGSGVADALAVPVARSPIAVQTLGAFLVRRTGAPVRAGEWKSRKARDLFKILVANRGRPLPRERLMDLLWPDEPAHRIANRLSVLLSTLRALLDPEHALPEPGPVLADRDTVALDIALVASDLDAFLTSAAAALAADRSGDGDAPGLLAAAAAAYTGEFLPEDPYTEWAQPIRDMARTTHIAVLRALTGHASSPDQREHYLLALLDHDPYDEPSHRELVRVLRTAGRHGEARRRYHAYLRRMNEIGVSVSLPRSVPG